MELGSIALMKKILTAEKSKVISCSFIMYIVDQKRGPRLADMEKMRTRQTMLVFKASAHILLAKVAYISKPKVNGREILSSLERGTHS